MVPGAARAGRVGPRQAHPLSTPPRESLRDRKDAGSGLERALLTPATVERHGSHSRTRRGILPVWISPKAEMADGRQEGGGQAGDGAGRASG